MKVIIAFVNVFVVSSPPNVPQFDPDVELLGQNFYDYYSYPCTLAQMIEFAMQFCHWEPHVAGVRGEIEILQHSYATFPVG